MRFWPLATRIFQTKCANGYSGFGAQEDIPLCVARQSGADGVMRSSRVARPWRNDAVRPDRFRFEAYEGRAAAQKQSAG